eukprot:5486585-Pleurochrysis_carterae.AAC.1
MWNDGSAASTPPPAAQCASCRRSPSAATAAAMSAGAMSPTVTPQRPTEICPSYDPARISFCIGR